MQKRVIEAEQQLQAAQQQHTDTLALKRKQWEKELQASMRQVEEQAANHLAMIRSDADGAQTAVKELTDKNQKLAAECATTFHPTNCSTCHLS